MDWRDNVKAQLGKNATAIWLVGGVILFLVDGGVSHLFSLRAAAFLGIGMFAAAIIVGGISYLLINAMAARLMVRFPDPTSDEAQLAMRTWRNVFGVINAGLAIFFVLWVYASFFWYSEEATSSAQPYEVRCKESLPVFTLGENLHPWTSPEFMDTGLSNFARRLELGR